MATNKELARMLINALKYKDKKSEKDIWFVIGELSKDEG